MAKFSLGSRIRLLVLAAYGFVFVLECGHPQPVTKQANWIQRDLLEYVAEAIGEYPPHFKGQKEFFFAHILDRHTETTMYKHTISCLHRSTLCGYFLQDMQRYWDIEKLTRAHRRKCDAQHPWRTFTRGQKDGSKLENDFDAFGLREA